MTYCDLQDLIDRYGETELIQLTDDVGSGVVDSAKVARTIADVDGEINAYLARRMALPMVTVPPVLVRIASVMVRYYLYTDVATDLVQQQYNAAIKFLQAVSTGAASLGADTSGEPTPETAAPSWSAGDSVFGPGALAGF